MCFRWFFGISMGVLVGGVVCLCDMFFCGSSTSGMCSVYVGLSVRFV